MKFVTFANGSRPSVPGALLEDLSTIVDLSAEFTDILALLDAGDAGLEHARQAVAAAKTTVQLADIRLLAPAIYRRRFDGPRVDGTRRAENGCQTAPTCRAGSQQQSPWNALNLQSVRVIMTEDPIWTPSEKQVQAARMTAVQRAVNHRLQM